MCGITGLINYGTAFDTASAIQEMNGLIAHRGPDDEGFYLSGRAGEQCAGGKDTPADIFSSRVKYAPRERIDELQGKEFRLALAHRRLSILDLSPAGHQPMCDDAQKLWITYNGEIYNYLEIREELKQLGHSFYTNTDTEVILAAYRQWGTSCVERFNGMWAFVLYDRERGEIFASRDRFGVKPFYYYFAPDVFAFASEQKALVNLPFVKTGINHAAAFDYFVLGEIEYEEEGMYKNILELFPAHSFTLNLESRAFKKWRYYELKAQGGFKKWDPLQEEEISRELQQRVVEAVRLRLRSDVPVGACLSGGIDSSSIVGIMTGILGREAGTQVFTAAFDDPSIDESSWAGKVVEATGVTWNKVYPKPAELLEDIRRLMYCQDVPIWSTSTYAQYRTMQLVKEKGIKVILDGQGGDELFAGYPHHYIVYWRELLKNRKLGLFRDELASYGTSPYAFFTKQYLKYFGLKKLPASVQAGFNNWYFKEMKYLDRDFLSTYKHRLKARAEQLPDSLNAALKGEFDNRLLKGYLKCEDRCSMFHSVESRTPFADDTALVEYALSIPSSYKIRNSVNKHILRQAMRPYLPEAIYKRQDKMGYATPNNKWITGLRSGLAEVFQGADSTVINAKAISRDASSLFDIAHKPENGRVFKFISFALWQAGL